MNASRAGAVVAVLGGLVWVVGGVLDHGQDVDTVVYAVGLVGVVVAFGVVGYRLVDHAPVWLRAVVCLATPALACAVWVAVVDAFDADWLPLVVGGVLLLVGGALGLVRGRPVKGTPAAAGGHRATR
jgi:hypothetical protein